MAAAARRRGAARGSRGPRKPSRGGVAVRVEGGGGAIRVGKGSYFWTASVALLITRRTDVSVNRDRGVVGGTEEAYTRGVEYAWTAEIVRSGSRGGLDG